MDKFFAYDLGVTDYSDILALQQELAVCRREKNIADILLLNEHQPVVTVGRFLKSGEMEREITVPLKRFSQLGIDVVPCDRGGRLTYHGPGQLVAYPIIHLREKKLGVKTYVRLLEACIIETLSHFGIDAQRREKLTGVWVGENKIAAIGLHVADGVSIHGLAINVDVDLSPFGLIVPCGIKTMGVTSIAAVQGKREVSMTAVKSAFVAGMARIFNMEIHPSGGLEECMDMLKNSRIGSEQAQSM